MSEWRDAKTDPPDACKEVLCYTISGHMLVVYLVVGLDHEPMCYQIQDSLGADEYLNVDEVTHWMPLPKPPEE